MATSTDLVINIIGNAKSGIEALDNFGSKAKEAESKWSAAKTGIALASAAAVAGVVAFGKGSIDAYSEAEGQQAQLERAYQKFPGIAQVSIDALRALNGEVQAKTGFDDDALAASEATLAQYGLTGQQIQQLTPLMADYAAKTGKDLGTAAEDMGKAVLGQGKALKAVGVDFKDTGDKGGNFSQIVKGLDGTVGGFATTMGQTASGQTKILNTEFENIQETVGSLLLPALTGLVGIGVQVTHWLSENPTLVQVLAIGLGVLAGALVVLNVAMWATTVATWASTAAWLANPITWVIVGIIALVAAIVLLATHWKEVTSFITTVWAGFVSWITGVMNALAAWWNRSWNDFAKGVSQAWNNGIVSPIRNAWQWVQNAISTGVGFISRVWNAGWSGLGGIVKGIFNGVLGNVEGGVNGAVDLINGLTSGIRAGLGAVGINIGVIPHVSLPRLASGTVTNGPMVAMIGDNPGGREVVSPLDTYQNELRRAYSAGQGSSGGQTEIGDRSLQKLAGLIVAGINRGATQAILDAI